jgi:hypothetical protein
VIDDLNVPKGETINKWFCGLNLKGLDTCSIIIFLTLRIVKQVDIAVSK